LRERDFRLFWGGQAVSELGTAFTLFALPLLVFELTGSSVDLAIATATSFLPYLLFGLVLGAWGDRLDRRRLMIATDLLRAAVISSVPLLAGLGSLHVWWIYIVTFVSATLSIAFDAAASAVVPTLLDSDDFVAGNSRLLIGSQMGHVVGPLLAGALLGAGLDTATVLYGDAASFLVSAASIALIATPLTAAAPSTRASIRTDVVDGLRFVFSQPLLRDLILLSALVNFTIATQWTQLVLFATERFDASGAQISVLWAAGSAGAILFALGAARLRRRVGFAGAVLGSLAGGSVAIIAFAWTPWFWSAVALWGLRIGLGQFGSINSVSLRQAVTPREMLSRVGAIGMVLAWSAIPAGALLGGWAIQASGNVQAVYTATGVACLLLAGTFSLGAVGQAGPALSGTSHAPAA
jgi:Major Facilitator Superfamily